MVSNWRQCAKCGKNKKVDYQSNCEDCRLDAMLDEFWDEVQSWRSRGMPEFAHTPGLILTKLVKRPWEANDYDEPDNGYDGFGNFWGFGGME